MALQKTNWCYNQPQKKWSEQKTPAYRPILQGPERSATGTRNPDMNNEHTWTHEILVGSSHDPYFMAYEK